MRGAWRAQWWPEMKGTVRLGLPMAFSQLLQFSLELTDIVMVGHFSADHLAAVALSMTFVHPLAVFCFGILLAVNPTVAHLLGAGKARDAGAMAWQGVWLGLCLSAVAMGALWLARLVVHRAGYPPAVVPLVTAYLEVFAWVFPAWLAMLALRCFCDGAGEPFPGLLVGVVAFVLKVGANLVLIPGRFGLPALGTVGAAWASVLVSYVSLAVMVLIMRQTVFCRTMGVFTRWRAPSPATFGELMKLGVPMGVSFTFEVLVFALSGNLVGRMGVVAMAAHQSALGYGGTMFMVPLGFSQAISSRVGRALGAGDAAAAFRAGWAGIVLCGCFMLVSSAVIFTAPGRIIGLFTSDPTVHALGMVLLVYVGVFQLADGVQVASIGALRGLKDTRVPMAITFFAYWVVGFTTAYTLGVARGGGPQGIWVGLTCGLVSAAVLHTVRFAWQQRRWPAAQPPDAPLECSSGLDARG